MKCNKCNYKTYCERTMYTHSSNCNGETESRYALELPLEQDMHCVCGFVSSIGNKMAEHLGKCGQKTCYPTLEVATENTVKRNMLDLLGLMRNDTSTENIGDDANTAQDEQEPIPFGDMEAQPIGDDMASVPEVEAQDQYSELVNAVSMPMEDDVVQYQTHIDDYVAPQHTLGAAGDIDMPLIDELNDANTSSQSAQYLGEVHTPMFDAMAAADQQDYNQLIEHTPNGQ